MDKFEEKEMMNRPFAKNTRYDWLFNYIPEPIKNGRWITVNQHMSAICIRVEEAKKIKNKK